MINLLLHRIGWNVDFILWVCILELACLPILSPDIILCGWLGSKHQLTIFRTSLVTVYLFACTVIPQAPDRGQKETETLKYWRWTVVSLAATPANCGLNVSCARSTTKEKRWNRQTSPNYANANLSNCNVLCKTGWAKTKRRNAGGGGEGGGRCRYGAGWYTDTRQK